MNINFELYRIFYTVAINESISKAARELYISQPAVSKSVKKLEDELGGKVFKRTKKGVILTEEGKELFNYVKNAMEYLKGAENKFKDLIKLEAGNIRIGINTTMMRNYFLPYLKEFHKIHPKITIEIFTGKYTYLMSKLKKGLIDLIILNIPFEKEENIKIIKCAKVHDCFVVNKNYSQLVDKELSIKELNNYPIIIQSKGSSTRNFLDNYCLEHNIIIKPTMSLTSFSLVKDFTSIGFGIGYLTKEFIKEEIKNKELFELKIKEKIPNRYIGIVYTDNTINFATKEMIKIMTKKNS